MPFGLKNALSHFYKAMVSIFEPILSNALIYIDDIFLFSPDTQSHLELLHHFSDILQQYDIMLSEKNMVLATKEIDFLGMHIFNGQYLLQLHISTTLQDFPDQLTPAKQIQQFLGLVNYMVDFVPHIAIHRSYLSQLLKKDAPPWDKIHTETVQFLKACSTKLPTL